METNCTAYIDNEPVRGFVEFAMGFGDVGLCILQDDGKQVTIPCPPYLIALDGSVPILKPAAGVPIKTGGIPAYHWEWRNLDLRCECGSVDYIPKGRGVYHCNGCDDYFYEKQRI